jgi:hypothetical protein
VDLSLLSAWRFADNQPKLQSVEQVRACCMTAPARSSLRGKMGFEPIRKSVHLSRCKRSLRDGKLKRHQPALVDRALH